MSNKFTAWICSLFNCNVQQNCSLQSGQPIKQPTETPQKPVNSPVPAAPDSLASLYRTMTVNLELRVGLSNVLKLLRNGQPHYEKAQEMAYRSGLTIPWEVIGAIHSLEGGLNFTYQILNGQPWTQRTTIAPIDLGPFTSWESAALAGIQHEADKIPKEWNIQSTLDFLERWNGLGYRKHHQEVNTPYLWSGSNHYTAGKYISDGKFSPTAISKQLGAALILQGLEYEGL